MALPPSVVAALDRHISTVREDWRGHPFEVGELAERHQLLPLVPEMFGLVALQRDGTVVELTWGSEEMRPVLAPKMRAVALLLGARRYHELSALIPERPTDARTCGACRGEGLAASVTCECGGLGWIPETWG